MVSTASSLLPVLVFWTAACTPAAAQGPPAPQSAAPEAAQAPFDHLAAEHLSEQDVQSRQDMVQEAAPSFLEVSGSATVSVEADRAVLSFAVETEGETAGSASGSNADRMEATLSALRSAERGARVETFGYTLQPIYRTDRQTQDPRIIGYRAINNVRVTIPDVRAVGTLIDAGIGAGANRVSGLSFEASDTEPARLEALREAVARARSEAEAIAGALGVELGPVLEVRGGAEVPSPRAYLMRAEMAAAATPIEPGAQSVSASVTLRYALQG